MIIKKVEIKNFRSIKEQTLECDELTALLGRNGSGKSSFLAALKVFYDVAAPLTEEDFFYKDINLTIEIRVTFGALNKEEQEEFKSFVKDDQLMVLKRINIEGTNGGHVVQRYYGSAKQIPQFAEIRAIQTKNDKKDAWKNLVDRKELKGLEGKVGKAEELEPLMLKYENEHPELLIPIEKEEQFFGAAHVGGGKLDNYTKYVLIPAVREAYDEATGREGSVYQLLKMIVLRKINSRQDIQRFKIEFQEKAQELYSSENLKELPQLGESITETLKEYAPGSEFKLKWGKIKLPEVQPPEAKPTLVEDDFEGEIDRKGHGLQRALILTLLQHLAFTKSEELTSEELTNEQKLEKETTPTKGPDLILGIEEPELYLHPSRCRYMADVLLKLTENPDFALGAQNQVIYTTHSPYFVDLDRFNQIRMARKVRTNDALVPNTVISRFSLEELTRSLEAICKKPIGTFTEDSTRAHTMPVMNAIVSEGFFANAVVVVEGLSEVGVLWKIQEIKKRDWQKKGIVVVPAGGKNNLDRPTLIFQGFVIPTYFVFDADESKRGTQDEKSTKERNHRYLCLAKAQVVDFPPTQVHKTWAVFEDDLETEYKKVLGDDIFQDILKQVTQVLGYKGENALKNIEVASKFVEIVYERGKSIPKLEEIVEKITALI